MSEREVYYWDIGLLVNFCCLLPWLWATARLSAHPVRWWRLLLVSLVGSGAAVLWAGLGIKRNLPLATGGTLLLLQLAFGPLRPARWLQSLIPFLGIGAAAAGLSLALTWHLGLRSSVGALIGTSLVAGGAPILWRQLLTRASNSAHRWQVRMAVGERSLCLDGLVDTGHQLRAPLTGLPVLLVAAKDLAPLLGLQLSQTLAGAVTEWDQLPDPWRSKVRMVPFLTVAKEGLLPAFRPDGLWLRRGGAPWQRVEALVGLVAFGLGGWGEYQVLLPPLLIESFASKSMGGRA